MNQPFVPNVIRFKKSRRREKGGIEVRRTKPGLYKYSIAVTENSKLFHYHLEMMRKTITNFFKRNTKVLIRIVPTISFTKKPNDVRRGRGKGTVESWYSFVRSGRIIVEFESLSEEKALEVSKVVRSKLPCKSTMVINENYDASKAILMSKKSKR